MLNWFAENPARYWWLVCFAIIWTLFIMLRPLLRPDWRDVKSTDWRWGLIILGMLIVGRWPTWFVTRQLNPDESQLIAGALTLRYDPVFWRSVDGGTAGPFDFYALWPVGWLHGADDYFSARVTALVLIAAALIFAHQSVALVFGRMVARVTGFAAVCFESLTLHDELLHYSTELVPMCLLAAAVYLAARRFVANAPWHWNFWGGLVVGAIPLAKLQATPLAALLGLGWVIGELTRGNRSPVDRRKGLGAFCAGGGVIPLAGALLLTATGEWQNAVIPYILYNVGYVDAANLGWHDVFARLWTNASPHESLLAVWLGGGVIWTAGTLLLPRTKERMPRVVASAAAGLCLASLICILVPRRPFLHYWQLMVVPWTLVLGALTGLVILELEKRRPAMRSGVLCAALVFTAGGLLWARTGQVHPYAGRMTLYQKYPRGRVAQELRKYAQSGEALGVWGWTTNPFYVEAGLRQATRNAHSMASVLDSPYYDYFRQRYLADLERSAPPVFIDAMTPDKTTDNFVFHHGLLRHEIIFPELADYVRAHYTQIGEMQSVRIYVRNDRLIATHPRCPQN
jgi:hypothetical protein